MKTGTIPRRVASLLWLLALAGCGHKPPPARAAGPVEVGVVVLHRQDVPLNTELPGRTAPFQISQVRPQVNGILQKRLFQEGAQVRAGQPLYQIDPATYIAARDQAQALLANAQASQTTASLKADRYDQLVRLNFLSKQDYDDAAATAGQTKAVVQQDQAALQAARINLGYTIVKAPISGRIGPSAFTPGALVTAGQADALTTIQQLDPIYVDLAQSSAELLALRRGLAHGQGVGPSTAAVRLILEDGSAYPLAGKLEFTDVTVDPSSGAVTLRAVFPNPDGVLLPGMFVRASLVEQTVDNAILVPQQGVSRDPTGAATVMVVGADGRAAQRTITADRTVGDQWLVTAGLDPGDRVIVEGLSRVKAGLSVRAVPAGSPPSRGPAGAGGQRQAKP